MPDTCIISVKEYFLHLDQSIHIVRQLNFMMRVKIEHILLLLLVFLLLAAYACGSPDPLSDDNDARLGVKGELAKGAASTTSVPPTATPVSPTVTSVPPTATPVSPTVTSVPPTATPVPSTKVASTVITEVVAKIEVESSPAKVNVQQESINPAISDVQCDIKQLDATMFVASSLPAGAVDAVQEWVCISARIFFDRPKLNWEMAGPIYVVMVDRNNLNSTLEVEEHFCSYLLKNHDYGGIRDGLCNPSEDPSDRGCDFGRCIVVSEEGEVHGSSISSSRHEDGFYLFISGSHDWPQHHHGYKTTTLHEMFHVFQISSISDRGYSHVDVSALLGLRSGDDQKIDVPWWQEGTATYLADLHYSLQTNDPDWLIGEGTNNLWTDYDDSGKGTIIDRYLESGTKLYNIGFDSDRRIAYSVGSWFVAYLINQVGEDKIYDFYAELEEHGFEKSFEIHFGKTYREHVDDFDIFLSKSRSEILSILPNTKPSLTPITDKSNIAQKISYINCDEFIKPDGSLNTFPDGGLNNSGDPSRMYICSNEDGTVNDVFQRQFESAIKISVKIDRVNYIVCGDIKNADGSLNTFPGDRLNNSLDSSQMYDCANEDKTVSSIYQEQIDKGASLTEVLDTNESNDSSTESNDSSTESNDSSTELTKLEYDEDRLCGGLDCLKCYACEECLQNQDCFSENCENGKCKPNNPGTKIRIGNSIPYTVHETFGFPQRTKNAHEKAFLMFGEEFYRLEPVVLFYVNGYDISLGDVEPTEPIPGTNQKSYEEVAQLWCDYILCDDVSAVEQSFRDGGKNDGGWGVTGRADAGHEGEPIWIYIETPYYLEEHGETGPAEGAIHEYIHLLHGAFGVPSCDAFQNITYDPKCAGPDWWSEGQADFIGAVYPFLRKNQGIASDFDAIGINKRFEQMCKEYVQSGAYARGARISHLETEANPGNWFFATRITASPREALEAWNSNSLPEVDDNGYWTHVYAGGACAVYFLLDQTIDENTVQYLVDFLPMVVEEDSWFLAFLKWTEYDSMEAFYTAFDTFLQSKYEATGPIGAQEMLGRCEPS